MWTTEQAGQGVGQRRAPGRDERAGGLADVVLGSGHHGEVVDDGDEDDDDTHGVGDVDQEAG